MRLRHSSTAQPVVLSGFTLIELLVVITIIGILMALTMPAVQQIRESAISLSCRNKLKNMATAVRAHEGEKGSFPPGSPSCTTELWRTAGTGSGGGNVCQGPNWQCNILKEMGEPVLAQYMYEAMITQRCAADDLEHEPGNIGTWTPAFCICPAADVMSLDQRLDRNDVRMDAYTAKGNYAACWGSQYYTPGTEDEKGRPIAYDRATAGAFTVVRLPETRDKEQNENAGWMKGAFKMGWGKGVRSSSIQDGSTNTLMLSEILGYDHSRDARGAWTLTSMGSSNFTAKTQPNPINQYDHIPMCYTEIPAGHELHCTENNENGQTYASARSNHVGGVNATFCDGAAKFMSSAVDDETWRKLSTRSGGENVVRP